MTLEELFEHHHASLFRFISRMTSDPDFAKDIVQETFLSIAGKALPDGTQDFSKAWLYQLARNLARSGMRKSHRRWKLLRAQTHAVPIASPSPPPDVDAEREQARYAVRRALAALSEKERTVLLMREEGFTHREIAQVVGTSTGSIGTMFARALAKLEIALDRAWREAP
jgi:RNA polymerase sigma-70 factor (ECF subfamily)